MTNKKTPNAFELALAARTGTIPPESIHGAARRLFRDRTLSDNQLAEYSTPRAEKPKQGQFASPQPRIQAKLS